MLARGRRSAFGGVNKRVSPLKNLKADPHFLKPGWRPRCPEFARGPGLPCCNAGMFARINASISASASSLVRLLACDLSLASLAWRRLTFSETDSISVSTSLIRRSILRCRISAKENPAILPQNNAMPAQINSVIITFKASYPQNFDPLCSGWGAFCVKTTCGAKARSNAKPLPLRSLPRVPDFKQEVNRVMHKA